MNYACSYEAFAKENFYSKVRMSDYDLCEDYLQGVEVVKHDYRILFEHYRMYPNVVFIVDPPYLSTDVGTYSNNYWRLSNYLDILGTLRNTSYFYFTSNKSSIVELFEWLENNTEIDSPFRGATIKTTTNQLTYNAGYVDIMLYKEKALR